jgi:hypothetical protein
MEKNTRIIVISGIVLVAGLVTYKVIAKNRNTTLDTLNKVPSLPDETELDEAPPIEDMGIYSDREIAAKKAAEEKKANEYTSEQLAEDLYKAFKGYGTSWAQGNTGGVTGIIARIKTDEDFDALNEAYGIRTLNSGFLNLFAKDYTGDMNGAFNSELTTNQIIKLNKILEDNGVTRRILPIPKFN